MKVGFLLNLTFLLCFLVTQLLIWLLDGTLVRTFAELLNMKPFIFDKSALRNIASQTSSSIYHNNTSW